MFTGSRGQTENPLLTARLRNEGGGLREKRKAPQQSTQGRERGLKKETVQYLHVK